MDYPVIFGERAVGKAQVCRQGLYYSVMCRCQLSGDVMCRLEVSCGGRTADLGILVPMEQGFGLDTRLPVSRIGEGELAFRVLPRHEALDGRRFVPIFPEEPFGYLARLKEAFLETREGQVGASLPQKER